MSDVLNPYYKIYISGKEIPSTCYPYVQGISIKKSAIGSSTCSISISDPDMLFIEGNMIVESTPIKIVYGINNVSSIIKSQEDTFEGYVSVIDGDFPESGEPSVVLHCMDKTHIMNRKKKTRTWEKCTASSVADKIFREYGFKTLITDSKTKIDNIQQSECTDIEFVIKLLDEIKDSVYLTYIEGETAYFVQRKASTPKATLVYRQAPYSLLSFQPRINKESKKEKHINMDININTLKIEKTVIDPKVDSLGSTKVQNSDKRK